MTRTYNYENDDYDFSYENSGASHEDFTLIIGISGVTTITLSP